MKTILFCVAVLPVLAACAAGPETSAKPSSEAGYEEREAPATGSNVSRRRAPQGAPAAK